METINNSNYVIFRNKVLGRGAFSVVYLGRYIGENNTFLNKNTDVAIKIIKTTKMTDKAKKILADEISIMEMIKYNPHPNIVTCYDVIETDYETNIIMENCDSGDFRTILKKPIKEKYAQFYFSQLANGLKYLDTNKILHRDIKPKNILLTNNRRILKIADFGFAKKAEEQSLHDTICGSPMYMAPEIMYNTQYNNQTDLWSVGMILYEMLYGFHPYNSSKTIPELKKMMELKIIEIPPVNTQNKDVSDSCLILLRKLLQKNATNRMTWEHFFNDSWINIYQYTNNVNVNNIDGKLKTKDNEYEKQLCSTSLGSINSKENNNTSKPQTTATTPPINMPTDTSINVLSMSQSPITKNITIIDNYFDIIFESRLAEQNKMSKRFSNNNIKDDTQEGLFDMELEDNKKIQDKNIQIRKINTSVSNDEELQNIEKSS